MGDHNMSSCLLFRTPAEYDFTKPVRCFYGHQTGHLRALSNFFVVAPYEFRVPDCMFDANVGPQITTITCAEVAIMVLKAMLMGDGRGYAAVVRSTSPAAAKAAGRRISPWNRTLWDTFLERVAYEVVLQKFVASEPARRVLLGTGEDVLVEASSRDRIWGCGLSQSDVAATGNAWATNGQNVLGRALMTVRRRLRESQEQDAGVLAFRQPTTGTEESSIENSGGDPHPA